MQARCMVAARENHKSHNDPLLIHDSQGRMLLSCRLPSQLTVRNEAHALLFCQSTVSRNDSRILVGQRRCN
jgi:hypothetical protein